MSLHMINEMRNSESLKQRIVAAASKAGVLNADQWVSDQMLTLVSAPGWEEAWQYAVDAYQINLNPDTGIRDDVINDAMITAEVQARIDALIAVEPSGDPSWLDPSKKEKEPVAAAARAGAKEPTVKKPEPQQADEQPSGSAAMAKQPVTDQRHKADPKTRPPASTRRAEVDEPMDPITLAHQQVQRPFPPQSERRSGDEDHTK